MYRCGMGYELQDNLVPPDRCNSDGHPDFCKDCRNYNKEYDLVERAIESAKCRIYRLKLILVAQKHIKRNQKISRN